MKILVCGGRHFVDAAYIYDTLDALRARLNISEIIAGGAQGADTLATEWAEERSIPYRVFLAAWHEHRRAAGPIRNQQMLDEGKPDLVVAFPGGRGTADMIKRAHAAGVAVETVGL